MIKQKYKKYKALENKQKFTIKIKLFILINLLIKF